ncbi:MAG: hypothetical protein AAF512_21420, partial [Pseudomonadota bacterium]
MYLSHSKFSFSIVLLFSFVFSVNVSATDHGSSCATATMVELGSNTPGELTEGDSDFFLVTAPDSGGLNVFTIGQTSTRGGLFDSNGVQLELTSSFSSGNFFITREVEAGAYCIEVSGINDGITGLYALQVEGDFASDDHGTDCDSATTINVNDAPVAGDISINGDSDFFLVRLTGPGHIRASTIGNTDTTGRLLDANGIQLENDFSSGLSSNFAITTELAGGTYCIEVSGHRSNNSTTATGSYLLQLEGDFAEDDHGTSCDSATIVGNSAIPGEL